MDFLVMISKMIFFLYYKESTFNVIPFLTRNKTKGIQEIAKSKL